MVSTAAIPAGFQWDYVFDWTIMKYQHQQPRIPPALESAQREVRRTPQDEERERHGSSFNRAGATAESSRRRCASLEQLTITLMGHILCQLLCLRCSRYQ